MLTLHSEDICCLLCVGKSASDNWIFALRFFRFSLLSSLFCSLTLSSSSNSSHINSRLDTPCFLSNSIYKTKRKIKNHQHKRHLSSFYQCTSPITFHLHYSIQAIVLDKTQERKHQDCNNLFLIHHTK